MSENRHGRKWTDGLDNVLGGQNLVDMDVPESLPTTPTVKLLPDVWVLKIGGQSIMDRGRKVVARRASQRDGDQRRRAD